MVMSPVHQVWPKPAKGTVKGRRRHGRQRKRWEDNIRKWTRLVFGRSQRAEENRKKGRKLVAKSSVVPQRPLRLGVKWCWWWAVRECDIFSNTHSNDTRTLSHNGNDPWRHSVAKPFKKKCRTRKPYTDSQSENSERAERNAFWHCF